MPEFHPVETHVYLTLRCADRRPRRKSTNFVLQRVQNLTESGCCGLAHVPVWHNWHSKIAIAGDRHLLQIQTIQPDKPL